MKVGKNEIGIVGAIALGFQLLFVCVTAYALILLLDRMIIGIIYSMYGIVGGVVSTIVYRIDVWYHRREQTYDFSAK